MSQKQKFVLALCLLGAVKADQEADVKEEDSIFQGFQDSILHFLGPEAGTEGGIIKGLFKNLLTDDYQTSFDHPSSNEIGAKEEGSKLFRLSLVKNLLSDFDDKKTPIIKNLLSDFDDKKTLMKNLLSDAYASFNHLSPNDIFSNVTPSRRQAVFLLSSLGQDGLLALLSLVSCIAS